MTGHAWGSHTHVRLYNPPPKQTTLTNQTTTTPPNDDDDRGIAALVAKTLRISVLEVEDTTALLLDPTKAQRCVRN